MPSRAIENYLKQLYLEEQSVQGNRPVAMGRIAGLMGVVPGTATTMVKTLAESGLAHYSPREGVKLSRQGKRLALHVLRRHRLVELFLVRVVGLDWAEVHDEAEELEHVISEKLLERMDAILGHPTVDPHGDPIPNSAGKVPVMQSESFVTCPMGRKMEITRVLDQGAEFLQFVVQVGLVPGKRFMVRERNEQADSVVLERVEGGGGGGAVALSFAAAGKFLVRGVERGGD